MNRIATDHLAREAIVYVRQSTADQVLNNVESRRRQYGLVERARQPGRIGYGAQPEPEQENEG
jgi:hypothetical protein